MKCSNQPIISVPSSSIENNLIQIGNPKSDIYAQISSFKDINSLLYPKLKSPKLSNNVVKVPDNKVTINGKVFTISNSTCCSKTYNLLHTSINYSKFSPKKKFLKNVYYEIYSDEDLKKELNKYPFKLKT